MDADSTLTVLEIGVAVSILITAVVAFTRIVLRSLTAKIEQIVAVATYPIQPLSNGGLSMSDLHNKVDGVIERQLNISDRLSDIETDISKIKKKD